LASRACRGTLILRLELALTEAASNIILHGFPGQQHPSITLTVEVQNDRADVTSNTRASRSTPGGGGAGF